MESLKQVFVFSRRELPEQVFVFSRRELPEYVIKAQVAFKACGVFQIKLTDNLLPYLQNLLERDVNWLRVLFRWVEEFDNELKPSFKRLASALKNWKIICTTNLKTRAQKEEERKKKNEKKKENEKEEEEEVDEYQIKIENSVNIIQEATYNCYMKLLLVLLVKDTDDKLSTAQEFAIKAYSEIGKLFDDLLWKAKLEYFKADFIIGNSQELDWNRMMDYLKSHFYYFIPKIYSNSYFIHPFYQAELKSKLNISNTLTSSQLPDFFHSFFCSLDTFEQFLQKNFQYHYVANALEYEYIFIDQLQKGFPNEESFRSSLEITECRSALHKNRKYIFNSKGLIEIRKTTQKGEELIRFTPKLQPDRLVFFGHDENLMFNAEIKLSIAKGNCELPAVLFINRLGLNIVDISPNYSVKIKFSRKLIDSDTVFLLGRVNYFWIQPYKGIHISNKMENNLTSLIFHQLEGCEYTKGLNNLIVHMRPGESFIVGAGVDAKVRISTEDMKEKHARVVIEEGKIFIEDLSGGQSFFLLKSRKRIEKKRNSKVGVLEKNPEFMVERYRFVYKAAQVIRV